MKTIRYHLDDNVFVVTGASRGIGFEIAKQLLEQNAKVVICSRKKENLDRAAADLGADESRLLAHPAHVAKPEEVDSLFDAASEKFGTVHALVNNVGMNIATGAADADPGLWQKIIDTNLSGSYLCARKAVGIMKENAGGIIVNISSIAGTKATPAMGIYGIAKAGIEMMTKVLACELAPFSVRVNAVAPCMVKTDFSSVFWSDDNLHGEIVKTIPMGRIAEPSDVVDPVLFLCSGGAKFITGQTLAVDGGALAC